jgi:hypothetical protein
MGSQRRRREDVMADSRLSRLFVIFVAICSLVLIVTACDGGNGGTVDSTPSPSRSPAATSGQPTATLSPEEEATKAYLRYWDAYAQAVLNLDASFVQGIATGEELQRIQHEIAELRSQGQAVRIRVEHNYAIVEASANSVVLFDEITNNSFLVDANSKEPTDAPGSGEMLRDTIYLEKTGDAWLVVRSTRQR